MVAAPPSADRAAVLDQLRARIARLEGGGAAAAGVIPVCAEADRVLPRGGLARAALHEVLAADRGAAVGFCGLLLARAAGPVLWIGAEPDLWPPGLAAFGLSPADLVLVRAGRATDGLWALEEALRCPAVAGAVLMVDGHPPDMTATRRLQLAAEAGGGIGLLLLPDADRIHPSVACTRWRVAAEAVPDPERPCWRLTLLRGAGGRPAEWRLAWHAAERRLRPALVTALPVAS
ncbi:conserved protein of unknown function [Rhodovastum atsumiense]|uniref:Damage-inducible mutagenesis protein n=1 Tax=Rhodovastum atsumiense TaxID=504468 RepID=A0A5M6IVV5_9PROT|nr:hypothetical protein [Rhodovastum atsumiense]KAA5611967.1 hypothetical protein F1189_11960 [Rhodovastum atsumiense]CAH2598746.1 conserved protein of unknown function [Rhodovastum atsumiense]